MTVELELRGEVAWVRLNRPSARNAINAEMLAALGEAVERAVAAPATRVVVLAGEGRAFCAGADIDWMRQEGSAAPRQNYLSSKRLASLFEMLDTLPLPLVARVHGAAMGGGIGLVAASDIAVASRSTVFAFPEVRLGLVPAVVGPYVVARVGTSRARDLFLSGRRFGGAEAEAWGLVQRLVEDDELDGAVDAVVEELLLGGPEALARSKRLLRAIDGRRPADVAAYTAGEIAAARAGAEGQAGLQAYLDHLASKRNRGDHGDKDRQGKKSAAYAPPWAASRSDDKRDGGDGRASSPEGGR